MDIIECLGIGVNWYKKLAIKHIGKEWKAKEIQFDMHLL